MCLSDVQLLEYIKEPLAEFGPVLWRIARRASGAVIPGAEVTATNSATQQRQVVKAGPAGFYAVESLAAGTYDLTIKKEGTLDLGFSKGSSLILAPESP